MDAAVLAELVFDDDEMLELQIRKMGYEGEHLVRLLQPPVVHIEISKTRIHHK